MSFLSYMNTFDAKGRPIYDHELQKCQMSLFAYFMNRAPRTPFSAKYTLKLAIDNLNDLECALFEVFWSSFDQMVFLRI